MNYTLTEAWIFRYSGRETEREREWERVILRQNTLYQGLVFYRSHFQDKVAPQRPDRNQQLWAISLTLFHSPLLTSNPSAVAVWRKGLQYIKSQFRGMLYLCHIKHERGVHTDIQQQVPVIKTLSVLYTYRKHRIRQRGLKLLFFLQFRILV